MRNQVQLITYVDRLGGGGLRDLHRLLTGPLRDVFGGVHLLPFYHAIDGADAGYDPIDHTRVDPRLGNWADVKALSRDVPVMADLIVNHVSADSPQFQDFRLHGRASRYAGMFLTQASVFGSVPTEAQLDTLYRPRNEPPFTAMTLENGEAHLLWTTFTSKQIDLNVYDPEGAAYLRAILETFRDGGISMTRLDAAGFSVKKAGTSCFMLPETYEFIGQLAAQARSLGMEVLVEIHSYYRDQIAIAQRVDRVYDFALPPLVLHALFNRTALKLQQWLAISPRNAITVLDTHDGIGIVDAGPDPKNPAARPGLLTTAELDTLIETIHQKSGGTSRQASGHAAQNIDLYQVNCTYYEALGRDDRDYLIARAIQFFAPGVPQVYYVGLLAGCNDLDLLARTQVGRDVNRHHYTGLEITAALARPVVQDLLALIRLRNSHPAFAGDFAVVESPDHVLYLKWTHGADWIELRVDFPAVTADIRSGDSGGNRTHHLFVHTAV